MAACRCVRRGPEAMAILVDLLDDLNEAVQRAASCALGRLGRPEARPPLLRLLREAPAPDVIDAIACVADEECVVLLGRIARSAPDLADAALAALQTIEHPRAERAIAGFAARRTLPGDGRQHRRDTSPDQPDQGPFRLRLVPLPRPSASKRRPPVSTFVSPAAK